MYECCCGFVGSTAYDFQQHLMSAPGGKDSHRLKPSTMIDRVKHKYKTRSKAKPGDNENKESPRSEHSEPESSANSWRSISQWTKRPDKERLPVGADPGTHEGQTQGGDRRPSHTSDRGGLGPQSFTSAAPVFEEAHLEDRPASFPVSYPASSNLDTRRVGSDTYPLRLGPQPSESPSLHGLRHRLPQSYAAEEPSPSLAEALASAAISLTAQDQVQGALAKSMGGALLSAINSYANPISLISYAVGLANTNIQSTHPHSTPHVSADGEIPSPSGVGTPMTMTPHRATTSRRLVSTSTILATIRNDEPESPQSEGWVEEDFDAMTLTMPDQYQLVQQVQDVLAWKDPALTTKIFILGLYIIVCAHNIPAGLHYMQPTTWIPGIMLMYLAYNLMRPWLHRLWLIGQFFEPEKLLSHKDMEVRLYQGTVYVIMKLANLVGVFMAALVCVAHRRLTGRRFTSTVWVFLTLWTLLFISELRILHPTLMWVMCYMSAFTMPWLYVQFRKAMDAFVKDATSFIMLVVLEAQRSHYVLASLGGTAVHYLLQDSSISPVVRGTFTAVVAFLLLFWRRGRPEVQSAEREAEE